MNLTISAATVADKYGKKTETVNTAVSAKSDIVEGNGVGDIALGVLFMNPAQVGRGIASARGEDLSDGTKKALGWISKMQGVDIGQGFIGTLEGITDFLAGGAAQLVGQKEAAKWIYDHSWSRDVTGVDITNEYVGDVAEKRGYQIASDILNGIGNVGFQVAVGWLIGGALAPSLAARTISQTGATALQFTPLFLSASGTGTAENVAKTGNLGWRENLGGVLKGGVEVATEIISPTGRMARSALFGKTGEYLAKQGIVKGVLTSFIEEAGEEGLSYTLDLGVENALKISNDKFSWSDFGYQAVIGGITGAIFGGATNAAQISQAKKAGASVYAQGDIAVRDKINEGLVEVGMLKERGNNGDAVEIAEAALAKLSTDDGSLKQSTKEYYLGLAEQMVMKAYMTEQYNAIAQDLTEQAKADPAFAQTLADGFNAIVNEAGGQGVYTAADFTNENSDASRIYVIAQMANDWLSPSLGENTVNAILTDRGEEYTGDERQKEAVRNLKDGDVLTYKIGRNAYAIITKQGGTNNYSIAYTTTEQMMYGDGEVMPVHKLSADDILGSGLDGAIMTNETINTYIDAQREQKATQEQEKTRQAAEEAEKKKDEKPSRSPAKTKKAERAEQRAKAKQAKTDATNAVERIVKKHFAFDKDGLYGTLGEKAKSVAADFMQKLKTAKAEYRDGIALSIADYLIDNVDMLDAMADGVSYEQKEQLQILRSYMHRIDLSGLQAEIRHHFDKNNGINAVWGAPKGAKSVAVPPDTLGMELAEYGIQLQGENEADLFIQLVEKYRSLRDAVSEKAQRQSVRDGLSAEELSKLRNTIADEVKAAVGIESAPADVSLSPAGEETEETTGSEATPGTEETEAKEATIEDLTSVEKRLIPDLGIDNSEFTKEEWTKARECVPNIDGLTRKEQARVLTLVRTAQANGINEDYMKGLARLSSAYGFGVMFNSEIRSSGMAIRPDGMVIINPRGENATIGHEIWHTIDQTSKDDQTVFRADLVEKIRKLVGAKQFDEAKDEYKRAYEAQFKNKISDADLDGEATASVVGKYLSNMTLLKKLAATDYSLGRGLLAAIRRMKDKWTSAKAFAKENDSTAFAEYRKMTRIERLLMQELADERSQRRTAQGSVSYSPTGTFSEKVVSSMSMTDCSDMILRVFNADVREYWEGEIKTAEQWLEERGVDEVAFHCENNENVYRKYLSKIKAYDDGDITAYDIIEAYKANALKGGERTTEKATRLDVSQERGYKDTRFYAPREADAKRAKKTYEIASQKVTSANRAVVYEARAKFLFLAHNENAEELFGISRAEINKRLRSWSRYPAQAVDISNRINRGIPLENRWTGIQNCSILNKQTVSDSDLLSMVKKIDGASSEYKRQYIARTMLALDTHIDWSNLSFTFHSGQLKNAKGLYADNHIDIGWDGYANTVAHEMGHALDDIWGNDILGSRQHLTESARAESAIEDEDARQFLHNFRAFIDSITDSADIHSAYTQRATEVFARFVARFVEFADYTAGNRFYQETTYYHDRFNASQFYEFARLLQEKAMLDSKRATQRTAADVSYSPAPVTPETDSRYLSLARDPQKNESELRRLVKEAAEKAGYNSPLVYHGTPNRFNHFSKERIGSTTDSGLIGRGFYFTTQKDVAEVYADIRPESNIIEAYLKIDNPFVFADYSNGKNMSVGEIMNDVLFKAYGTVYKKSGIMTEQESAARSADFSKWLKENHYDSAMLWSQIMILDSNQAKRADPVTYDDSGNVVPLSERFNPQNDDIRYSPASDAQHRVVTRVTAPRRGIVDTITNKNGDLSRANVRRAIQNLAESAQIMFTNAQQAIENQLVRMGMTKSEAAAWSQWARTARAHGSNAIQVALADMKGNIRARGLMQIIEPFLAHKGELCEGYDADTGKKITFTAKGGELAGKRYLDFSDYLGLLNAIDREIEGKNPYSSLSAEEMKRRVAEYEKKNPDFKKAADELSEYNAAVLDIGVQSGLMSQEFADKLRKMYPHYITMRTMDSTGAGKGSVKGARNIEINRGIQTATESDHRVDDPLKSYAEKVQSFIKAAKLNMVYAELYRNADGENVIRAEASQERAKELREMEKRFLKDPTAFPDPTELFRKFEDQHGKLRNEITFYDNGKAYTMAVSDRIYAGVTDLAGVASTFNDFGVLNFAKKANDIFKKLVTNWNPFFGIKNIARDLQDGSLQTRYSWGEYLNEYRKNAQMMASGKFDERWTLFVASGALEASLVADNNMAYKKSNKAGLEQAEGLIGQYQRVSNFNTLTEALPRFTEFCLTLKHGGTIQQALYNAADVTVNFGRSGKLVRVLNATVMPFLNPAVQGMDRVLRLFTEDGWKNNKALASLLIKAVLLAILPMALSNAMYGGDEEYEDMKDSVKENNYLFKVGDTWLKLPRGRVVSTIAGLYNRSSKQLTGKDVDWGDYGKNVLDQITPAQNFIRHIGSPFVDVANNKTWYGSAIESQSLQNYAVKDRYDENTSRISVWIGQFTSHFGLSPKKVNYLIDQYTGVIGDILLPTTTPAGTRGVVSYNFTVDPNTSSNLSTRFYKLYDETMYAANGGDEEAYYLKRRLDETKNAASELFKEIKTINADSSLSNKEKVKQASAIRAMINQLYKTALQDAKGYSANVKDALAIKNSYGVVQITQSNARQYGLTAADAGKYAVTFGDQSVKLYGSEKEATEYNGDTSKKTIYAEANRLTYGSEYALKEYNTNVYEKAKTLNELGISYDEYYNYYMTVRYYSGKDKKQKILAYLNGSGMSKSQVALMMYYSGYSAYKKDAEKAIKASSLSAERKKELLAGITD